MDKEYLDGLMAANLGDSGCTINLLKELWNGLMEEFMKDNISMIWNRELESLYGQMEEYTLESGIRANNMGMDTLLKIMKHAEESGKWVKGLDG